MKDVLFPFVFNVLLAELTSMLWVIVLHGYKSLSHKPRSKWDHLILQYAVIACLILFALHLVQFLDLAIGESLPNHNKASSMLYCWCNTGVCSSFTNSSPHIESPVSPKDFEFWFVCQKDFIPLLLSSLCAPLPTRAFWNCFASSTVVSWQQFWNIGQLHCVFSSQWMLK